MCFELAIMFSSTDFVADLVPEPALEIPERFQDGAHPLDAAATVHGTEPTTGHAHHCAFRQHFLSRVNNAVITGSTEDANSEVLS